jgi:hypothetical protein
MATTKANNNAATTHHRGGGNLLCLHLSCLPLAVPLLNLCPPLLAAFPHRAPAPAPRPPASTAAPVAVVAAVPLAAPAAATATTVVVVVVIVAVPGPGRATAAAVWARAAAAPAVAPEGAMQVAKQLPPQVPADLLDVHKVAVSAAVAAVLLELPAGGLPEVSHRRELGDDGAARVVAALQRLQGAGRLLLLAELHVHVPDHVVREVVADVEALDLAVLAQLHEDVLVEVLEVLLDPLRVDGVALRVHARGDHVRPLVHVAEQQRRGDGRLVVQAGAPVAVAACADLEVEGAVHAVLLRAKDGRKMLSHGCLITPLPARLVA